MDILDGLAPRQQQGGGGLLGMLGNPMAQAYIAQILKGLSPYSNLNPDDMLARAQRMQLAEQERAREDFYKRQQQDMAERGMSLREREEMRGIDQGVAQRKAYADAWRHMQANPGAEGVMGALQQYGESMTESGRNALLRHAEFLEKQSGKATDKARNAPAGYLWVDENDPSKGVTAIKGGPAEKLPAEFAGRIGLAKSFLGQMPSIRERLEKGEISSPSGSLRAWMGRGKEGELRRQIDSGADALVRGLTGAGMAIAEAQNYARRYQFHPWDTKEDQISKLDQLQRELETIAEVAQAGRGRPAGDGGGSAGQSEPKYKEGQTATGPGGKKLIFRGGEWVEQ
jgi:hypothetical protein